MNNKDSSFQALINHYFHGKQIRTVGVKRIADKYQLQIKASLKQAFTDCLVKSLRLLLHSERAAASRLAAEPQ
ncbi:hypothetical protein [Nostoc sp.]|uniref:hypothetical protein n=1 Tax=Nostoc sp. TaxID=1180 RepID=UPI002FF47267